MGGAFSPVAWDADSVVEVEQEAATIRVNIGDCTDDANGLATGAAAKRAGNVGIIHEGLRSLFIFAGRGQLAKR
jgi:hypothetical protein